MLDLDLFRKDPQQIRDALVHRQLDPSPVEEVLELDRSRRAVISEVEALKAERNTVSKAIGQTQEAAERQTRIEAMRKVGEQIDVLDARLRAIEAELDAVMASLPNLPDRAVPVGEDESQNVVLRTIGAPQNYSFEPRPHWELGLALGILDFERGTKLAGSRFYILTGAGARLQRALIAFMLDLHIRQGYVEQYLPFMVKSEIVYAAGQLPKFADNLYKDHEEDFYMVPTAEVPLTGLHMGEILDEADLPRYYTAYTPCFRREKMSAGRDVRGIKRGHQFDKVEMYAYTRPEQSAVALEKMLADAEETCRQLGFTYRIKQLCTGDLGFGSAITYDIEVWAAGCREWLEVSSVSTDGEFQARRASIRYRPADGGRPRYVHTLNGSGLGLPRTLIAVLENNQQEDGSVTVPEVLHPWMAEIRSIGPSA